VRTMQEMAQHVKPFALAVAEAMKDQDTGNALSPTKLIIYVGLRVYVVIMGLLLIFALSRLFQMFIGNGDIVMEEEVVIVHEHDTEEEAAKARAAQSRGKKQKAQ
jgi:CBS domain-containing protein